MCLSYSYFKTNCIDVCDTYISPAIIDFFHPHIKMLSNTFSLLALLPLATAHFVLDWPTNRGFDDEQAVNGPCGGFNDVKTRTDFPLSGGPIQLDMHHTQTKVAVYLALGNDPTSYSITLLPQLAEEGPGDFCLGSVNIPSDLNITSGTNATIQVVSNGDPSGGLYQVRLAMS